MAEPALVVLRAKGKMAHGVDALEDEVFELYEVCSGRSITLLRRENVNADEGLHVVCLLTANS